MECPLCGRKFKRKSDYEKHISEHESCQPVLELEICKDDVVILSVGRYMYRGRVVSVRGSSIIIDAGDRTISVKKSKINMIEKVVKGA
ncbi:MAG: C2H2-type zinc finger protein [Sulfolobales archaeon]